MNVSIIYFSCAIGSLASQILDLHRNYVLTGRNWNFSKTFWFWFSFFIIFILPIMIVPILAISSPILAFAIGFSTPLILHSMVAGTNYRVKERELEENLQSAEVAVKAEPDRSRPLWELSRIQLEIYINRNLSQIRSIYWITLFVMIIGFGLISYGVFQAVSNAKIDAAIIATSAGVLTEFIGATFLLLYRSTMNQAGEYVQTLERINAVGMALQVVDQIGDADIELKNKAKIELAGQILGIFSKFNGSKSDK